MGPPASPKKHVATKRPLVAPVHDSPSKSDILSKVIDKLLHDGDECYLPFSNVEEHVARTVILELKKSYEHRGHRCTYNSALKTFSVVTMPSPLHECHASWLNYNMIAMGVRGFLSLQDAMGLQFLPTPDSFPFVAPYANSHKQPDLVIHPLAANMATLVIEAGWTEPRTKLHDDMRVWIHGGQPTVQIVFVIKYSKNVRNEVSGDIEVFRHNGVDGPVSVQKEIIFPVPRTGAAQQKITITKKDLWGQYLPAGYNPAEQWDLTIDTLRNFAVPLIRGMGLTPKPQ